MENRGDQPLGPWLIGALLGPPVVTSAYLSLSRWPTRWFTAESDWAALVLSLAVSVVCLSRLPLSVTGRVALACLYVPIAGFALVLYMLSFVGIVFGDWL